MITSFFLHCCKMVSAVAVLPGFILLNSVFIDNCKIRPVLVSEGEKKYLSYVSVNLI